MPAQHDDALCLRQWDWSETSQTAVMFARSLGLLRVLAKGSKRPKAPYSGGLEMLTLGRLGVIQRPNSELALLTEWDLTRSFPALRHDYVAHTAGLYVADLLTHLIRDADPHPALFDAAIEALDTLGLPSGTAPALLRFQWRALIECGVRPLLDADARTGEALAPIAADGVRMFSPELGGIISSTQEQHTKSELTTSGLWRVRQSTLDLLLSKIDRSVEFSRTLPREPGANLEMDPRVVDRANRFLASYLRHVLGVSPPTMNVVFPSGLSR